MKTATSIPLTLCLLLAGCASYHYEISTPDAAARQISKDDDLIIPASPAQLRLRQVDSRCVLMVENTGQQDFGIDGVGSAIIDPAGQSHAIASQSVPPGSHVKFILPPYRDFDHEEPGFHFGIGVGTHVDADAISQPREAKYLYVSTDGQEYWEWDGEGSIRIILALKQGDQTIKHTFNLDRHKK